MEWIFSGIGSTIIGIILTLLLGGIASYKTVSKRRRKSKSLDMEDTIDSPVQQQSSGKLSPVVYGDKNQVTANVNNTTNNYNQPVIVLNDNNIKGLLKDILNEEVVAIQDSLFDKLSFRINSFQKVVNDKVIDIEKAIEALKNPEVYQDTLNACKAAAFSNKNSDYEILTELLVNRYEMNDNVCRNAGIKGAISIVNQVSDEAMLGLTLLFCYTKYISLDQSASAILDKLDGIFSKFMYANLPSGKNWIYNLEMLNAVSLNYMEKYKDAPERYREVLKDFVVTGVAKESDSYVKAVKLVKEASFPCPLDQVLIDNDLLEGYVIVNGYLVNNINKGTQLKITRDGIDERYDPTDKQKEALRQVLSLYSHASDKKLKVNKNFNNEWNKRSNLTKLSIWLKQLPCNVILTPIGMALAHANAKRFISIPQFDEYEI